MELAREVIREVVSDRIAFTPMLDVEQRQQFLEMMIKEAEIFLLNGLEISVHILLGHEQCKARLTENCKACCEVEVWTIQVSTLLSDQHTEKALMFPTFLKQAIRSQLHFSPMKSWFSSTKNVAESDESVSQNYNCICRISTSSYFQNKENTTAHGKTTDQHRFPPCKFDEKLISVGVKWLKKEHFPTKIVKCPSERIDSQLWISPSHYDGIENEKKSFNKKNSKEIKIAEHQSGFSSDKKSAREKRANIIVELPEQLPEPQKSRHSFEKIQNASSSDKFNLHVNNYKSNNNKCLDENIAPSLLTPTKRGELSLAARRKLFHRFFKRTSSPYSRSQATRRTPTRLLCNFEESILKGCLRPIHVVDGFKLQLAITANSLAAKHTTIPVTTSYFSEELSSLYMSKCIIPSSISNSKCKPGIQIPRQCLLQVVLFNTQGSVVKIFLLQIDVSDMPPLSQTFIRQRTVTSSTTEQSGTKINVGFQNASLPMPSLGFVTASRDDAGSTALKSNHKLITGATTLKRDIYIDDIKSENSSTALKFLIHIRLLSDYRGRIFIHGDIKMLLSNKGSELEGFIAMQTQSTTLMPQCPKYSPIK